MTIRVKARGLDGFVHDCEVAQERLKDNVRDLMSDLADETASDARGRARPQKLTGAAMDSIRALGPVVRAGDGIEHYGFADFGGTAGEGRRIKRRYIKGGRWLFPAVRDVGVVRRAEDAVDRATEDLR